MALGGLSAAVGDLYGSGKRMGSGVDPMRAPGLGDQQRQEMEDEDELRRKKKQMAPSNTNPAQYGDLDLPPATSALFGRQAM